MISPDPALTFTPRRAPPVWRGGRLSCPRPAATTPSGATSTGDRATARTFRGSRPGSGIGWCARTKWSRRLWRATVIPQRKNASRKWSGAPIGRGGWNSARPSGPATARPSSPGSTRWSGSWTCAPAGSRPPPGVPAWRVLMPGARTLRRRLFAQPRAPVATVSASRNAAWSRTGLGHARTGRGDPPDHGGAGWGRTTHGVRADAASCPERCSKQNKMIPNRNEE